MAIVPADKKRMNKMNDKEMYGCNPERFKASVIDSLTYKFNGGNMVVVSMLSDVQHMIEFGEYEKATQYLNLAKRLLMNIDDGDLVGKQKR